MIKPVVSTLLIVCTLLPTYAVNRTAVGNGNWESAGTWSPSGVPTCGDLLVIPSGVTVMVADVNDYFGTCGSPGMEVHVYGTLEFQTGKKLWFPCGSAVLVFGPDGLIDPGNGGGNSNNVQICGATVWQAGDGPVGPDNCFPQPECQALLPIHDVKLTARVIDDRVRLTWSNSSLDYNVSYTVQRSQDGVTFETIERVEAGRQTSDVTTTDHQPLSGTSYYRVRVSSRFGSESYSPLVAVEFSPSRTMALNIYPNPGHTGRSVVTVHSATDEQVTIQVHTSVGQEVYSQVVHIHGLGNSRLDLACSISLFRGCTW